MKTLHILLKDRAHEIQKEVPDDFELLFPKGITPTSNGAFVLPDLFVNLQEVVAMWVTKEEEDLDPEIVKKTLDYHKTLTEK